MTNARPGHQPESGLSFPFPVMAGLFLMLLIAPHQAGAEVPPLERFDAANQLYEARQYAEAAAAYEFLLATGNASPALFFNLGNARFKSGEMGHAIVAYRHAARLTPRDPDVRANLRFARNQVQGPTLRPTRLQRAFGLLSLDEWTRLTAGALWLTLLLSAAGHWRPAWRPGLRTITLASGGATLVLTGCLLTAMQALSPRDVAVVTARDVMIRNGPFDESQTAFTANDGAELRVLDQKDDWLQVTDGTRRVGWLKSGEVARP